MAASNIIKFSKYRRRKFKPLSIAAMTLVLLGSFFIGGLTRNFVHANTSPAVKLTTLPMPICVAAKRINCVIDGDTIWLSGEKIRISTYNTPERSGRCRQEILLAEKATKRLSDLLSNNPFIVDRQGLDIYKRRLATVKIDGRDVGNLLISEGLAHKWVGYRKNWC